MCPTPSDPCCWGIAAVIVAGVYPAAVVVTCYKCCWDIAAVSPVTSVAGVYPVVIALLTLLLQVYYQKKKRRHKSQASEEMSHKKEK